MIDIATSRHASGVSRGLAAWMAQLQRQLANRVHADGDDFAREHRWAIATTTGRLGLGTRAYRDPRFGQRAPAARQRSGCTGGRSDARSG